MGPRLRKVMLAAHIATSVGWLGAVGAFLTLAVLGLTSQDTQVIDAAYLIMAPITWYAIVPAAIGSLLTGLIQSLGTTWGLIRHYWVLAKLVITVLLIALLWQYTPTVDYLADAAANPTTTMADLQAVGASPVVHAGLAIVALLVPLALSIVKPRGPTGYGARDRGRKTLLPPAHDSSAEPH